MKKEDDKYYYQKQYAKKNLVKLAIDVKPEIRENFDKACKLNNTNRSKVLKQFVNDYIQKYEKSKGE